MGRKVELLRYYEDKNKNYINEQIANGNESLKSYLEEQIAAYEAITDEEIDALWETGADSFNAAGAYGMANTAGIVDEGIQGESEVADE